MKRKVCNTCGERKTLTAFYFDSYHNTYRASCKECVGIVNKRCRDRPESKSRKKKYELEYFSTRKGKLKRLVITKRYQRNNPKKTAAHSAVWRALRDGKLVKKPCAVCKSRKQIEAHHPDYDKPLKVIWLCNKHHREVHRSASSTK